MGPDVGEEERGIGDEGGGERGVCSEVEATLELDPSTFDFLKRLRSDSFECNLRGGATSAPVPADLGRRLRGEYEARAAGSPSVCGSEGRRPEVPGTVDDAE